MDILLYLLELIKIRKEIGINGLGTIYKKKSPGRYDTETHMFMPPSYVLAFTSVVKEDNHLAQYIAQKRNISLSSTNYFINEFAEDIKKEIASGKHHELKNLGTFFLEDDEIQFTPAKDTNFGFDFYALPPVNEVVEKDILGETAQASKAETHQEENNNAIEKSPSEVKNDDINEIKEEHKTVELENILEEIKQEEQNPGDDVDADEVYEEIAEINPQIIYEQTEVESYQWDFEGNNVADPNSSDKEEKEQILSSENESNKNAALDDISKKVTVPEVENITDTQPAIKNWEFEDGKFNDDVASTDNETYEEKKSIPLYLKFLIAIVVVLVIGAVVYFVNPGIFSAFVKNDNDTDQKIVMPIAGDNNLKTQIDSMSFADSIVNSAQKAGLQVDSARDTLKVTTAAKPLDATTYEIVAAAFKTQREVNKYIETMKRKGIAAKEIPTAPGKLMKKISLASFNNPDSAKKDLERLKKQLKRPELYIFVNKPR